tara:strand:- start:4867 stop:6087 length:1221 start_codon:yes stop_codon:yes gene_type:complete
MKVKLISIGDEVLSGDTLNTNVSWIGKHLTPIGCQILEQLTIPDKDDAIKTALELSFGMKFDLVITTGGLGPTSDDITRDAVFDFIGTDYLFDNEYWKLLKQRYGKVGIAVSESNRSQAIVPTQGQVIPNLVGSARGFQFEVDSTTLILLPGVPKEMKSMIKESIIPFINSKGLPKPNIELLRTTGIPESSLVEKINPAIEKDHQCSIGYYPSAFGVDLRIKGENPSKVKDLFSDISSILEEHVYAYKKKNIEEIVVSMAIKKRCTIAISESCTGGLVGSRITNVPGSSRVFMGGVIAYSNHIKTKLLDVKIDTLETRGSVSNETAKEMAVMTLEKFKVNYAVSITGIAGPDGGSKKKPVGLVYIGIANKEDVYVKKYQFRGDRDSIKLRTSQAALNMIRIALNNE